MQETTSARTALAPAPGRVLGADPHDFAGLYVRHRSSFTSHARRYLRDPRDADEVVQEAFLRLFLALPELESELQALAYCRRTITNLCIDRYRADARRPRLVALEGQTVDELAEDDHGDPVVRAEDAAVVREALSRLPALHRDALVKREIEEKPLPVIAEELDVAEENVKHVLFRARRALRKLLAGTSVAPGADGEASRGLRPVRGASGGLAGLLVLALLGLGSGPDLRAVPVVGVDLPDVLGVTEVAEAVGDAVRSAVRVIAPQDDLDAAASQPLASRPVSESDPLPGEPARTSAATGPSGTTGTPVVPGGRGAVSGVPLLGPASAGKQTTVFTVVDGVPVITVLPALAVPATGRQADPRGGLTEHDAGPLPPGVAAPLPDGPVRELPGRASPLPALDLPSGVVVDAPGRRPRPDGVAPGTADKVAEKAADRAADRAAAAAEREQDKQDAALDRAADKADRTAEHAAAKAEQAGDKADRAALKGAEQAAKAAEQAAKAAEKAAQKAAQKASEAAQRAAERAAAEQAAAAAAELAAVQAAQQAAAQAAQQAAQPAGPAPVTEQTAPTTVTTATSTATTDTSAGTTAVTTP